jgi:hypothetical protein
LSLPHHFHIFHSNCNPLCPFPQFSSFVIYSILALSTFSSFLTPPFSSFFHPLHFILFPSTPQLPCLCLLHPLHFCPF